MKFFYETNRPRDQPKRRTKQVRKEEGEKKRKTPAGFHHFIGISLFSTLMENIKKNCWTLWGGGGFPGLGSGNPSGKSRVPPH